MVYVCGFAVDFTDSEVLLVEKQRPSWQRGKLNGIGGRVNSGEKPCDAMAREFKEETLGRFVGSALYLSGGWTHGVTVQGDDWQCLFFVGHMNTLDIRSAPYANDSKERLIATYISDLMNGKEPCVTHVKWLIQFLIRHRDFGNLPLVLWERSKVPAAVASADSAAAV